MRTFRSAIAAIAISLIALASAQAPAVAGRITDTSQGMLPGVVVTIVAERGGVARHTTSDAFGQYRVDAVPGGTSELTAFDSGFERVTQRISPAAANAPVFRLRFTGTQDVADDERARPAMVVFLGSLHARRTLSPSTPFDYAAWAARRG